MRGHGLLEMAEFGREKIKLLKRFLKLKHGIPSHDTFSTVLRMLDPRRSMPRSARSPRDMSQRSPKAV